MTLRPLLSLCLCLFFCFYSENVSAQNDSATAVDTGFTHITASEWLDQGMTVGLSFNKYLYGEIGYHRSLISEFSGFPVGAVTMNYATEFSYIDGWVLAPKVQGRVHGYLVDVSLAALCYTDLESEYSVRLRPEIGFGLWFFDVSYGYNIGIYTEGFESLNKNVFSVRCYIPFHRKYTQYHDSVRGWVPAD